MERKHSTKGGTLIPEPPSSSFISFIFTISISCHQPRLHHRLPSPASNRTHPRQRATVSIAADLQPPQPSFASILRWRRPHRPSLHLDSNSSQHSHPEPALHPTPSRRARGYHHLQPRAPPHRPSPPPHACTPPSLPSAITSTAALCTAALPSPRARSNNRSTHHLLHLARALHHEPPRRCHEPSHPSAVSCHLLAATTSHEPHHRCANPPPISTREGRRRHCVEN